MSYISERPAAAAAILVLCLFYGAGLPPAAGAQNSTAAWGSASMPDLMKFPGLSDAGESKAEETTPYRAGVKAYLDGNDDEAITRLEEALKADPADEKAKQLLLKVTLRAVNGNYDRGNYKKAHALILKAYARFPTNPEVKLLHSSMTESKAVKAAEPREEAAPAPTVITGAGARHGTNRAEGREAQFGNRQPAPSPMKPTGITGGVAGMGRIGPRTNRREVAGRAAGPMGPMPDRTPNPQPPPAVKKAERSVYLQTALEHTAWLAAIVAALLLSAAPLSFLYFQRKHEKILLLRIESLQKALVEAEVRKTEVYSALETRRKAEKQDEELAAVRRAKEERMQLELEKLKAEEETRLRAEIAEKRREAERTAPPPPPPPPPPAPSPVAAKPRENEILEVLVDVTPPERDAAWERIAARAVEIYGTSPEAAIKFLYDLSKDANPLNRASIVGALASIGAPATLDVLFELYKDPSMEVRRETIKHLNRLLRNPAAGVDETYREKISACLKEEKEKGDWIF